MPPHPRSTLFPYTTLFRSRTDVERIAARDGFAALRCTLHSGRTHQIRVHLAYVGMPLVGDGLYGDRKSTRLNSSHMSISYAVFCLKKKNKTTYTTHLTHYI